MQVITHLIEALRRASRYNPDVQAAPHCVLWTDAERQWEGVVARMQRDMPELFVLGEYAPEARRGPALWLRVMLAEWVQKQDVAQAGATMVLYLPGVSRQDLRAVDSCPPHLKPLAELQYRGVIWSQSNGRDWTVMAFLQTANGGLNLDVALDKDTKAAMQLALPSLLEQDVDGLRGRQLDRADFYGLISTDPAGELLKWLNQPAAYQAQKSADQWHAFNELCRFQFMFHPESEGPLSAAEKLARHETAAWPALWQRYSEAAQHYGNIQAQIEKVAAPTHTLDWNIASSDQFLGWPQWNAHHENGLRAALSALREQGPDAARSALADLEKKHSGRRETVWARLGLSPLARALEHLAQLAAVTAETRLTGGTLQDLATGYQANGWRADDAVMRALACVTQAEDQQAVTAAIRAVYMPWAESAASYLQQVVSDSGYPATSSSVPDRPGLCMLFVDALRFDVGQRLAALLAQSSLDVQQRVGWAALPSVTATGKPAVSPVQHLISGADSNADFEPQVTSTGKSANKYHLDKLLAESGWQVLGTGETGSPQGKAWGEIGDIDKAGHAGTLPLKLEAVLDDIVSQVQRLLNAGWQQVDIVTDHGWLYLPDGFEKAELLSVLAENEWGRCAAIKPGAHYSGRQYPWYWNPVQHFALAPGIRVFRGRQTRQYTHGGLSLQECLIPALSVRRGRGTAAQGVVSLASVNWRELRCQVIVSGGNSSITVDIRTKANDATSSLAVKTKQLKADGTASLVVEDEELIGRAVFVIVLDADGQILAQKPSVIGGEPHV